MLLKDLKDEYVRRMGGTEKEVSVFFSGASLDLLGGPAQPFGGLAVSTALSAGTYAMLGPAREATITLQESKSDLMLSCDIDKLGLYKEKDWGAPIFKTLENLNNSQYPLSGANLLFRHSIDDPSFYAANIAAAAAMTNAAIQPADALRACALNGEQHQSKTGILASAAGRAGTLMLINAKNYDYSYIRFQIPTYKLVFTVFENKKPKNLQPEFEKCFDLLKKKLPALSSIQDLKKGDIELNSAYLQDYKPFAEFALHEYQRVLWATEALRGARPSALSNFGLLLYESGRELLPLFGKSEKALKILSDVAAQTELAEGSRVLDNGRGIFSLVNDAHVDAFTERIKAAVTEQASAAPVFYICKPADSGVQITT